MSHGLYISNGTDGAVITNSNSIFNEEIFSSRAGSLTSSESVDINIDDVGDPTMISFTVDESTPPNIQSVISSQTSGNTLTLSNSGNGNVSYDLRVFRFR